MRTPKNSHKNMHRIKPRKYNALNFSRTERQKNLENENYACA